MEEYPNGTLLAGPLARVGEELVKTFKFRSQIIFPKERIWGIKANGTFSGYLGAVQRGEVDVMLGPMAPTVGRNEAVDFTVPYDVNYVSVMTWRPVKFVDPFNFVRSFSGEVWLGILICWIAVSFATRCLDFAASRHLCRGNRTLQFPQYLWLYFKVMFPNSFPDNQSSWFRILLGIWMLALVVLMGSLSGILTSTMLVRKTTDRVDDFEDLFRYPKTRVAAETLTYFERLLTDPVGDTFKRLSNRHERVVGMYRPGARLDAVMASVLRKERVMLGTDVMLKSHIADNYVRTGQCRHQVAKGTGGLMHIVMLLRKTLTKDFKRKLDAFVSRINQCNIYHKEMEWRLRNYTRCVNIRDDAVQALALTDIQGSFFLLLVGLAASLLVFLSELCSMPNKFISFCGTGNLRAVKRHKFHAAALPRHGQYGR
ncbi:glutamate receptor ionotropic, NMDA 2B-like [Ornithodoros turicata]|uniref:glutamate receptor ionotropic, NMDA 2B-like n=1 Tax=Ornithodoros turicata TaxID=34597 RepID=UPI003139BE04